MDEEAVTIRIDSEKRAALDTLAHALDRDRNTLILEAIEAYLDVHRWQMGHIAEGIRQADAGEFAEQRDVTAAFERFKA